MASWGNAIGTQYDQDMRSPFEGGFNFDVLDINRATFSIRTTNSHANGKALEANGKTELNGDTEINGDVEISDNKALNIVDGDRNGNALFVKNSDAGASARALKVEGKSEFVGAVIVGDGDNAGVIDSIGDQDLKLGTGGGTENVLIGIVGNVTNIKNDLRLGAIGGVGLGSRVDAYDDLIDLYVGTDVDYTKNVILSRTGQTTQVQGALDIDQNANFDGTLHVDGNVDFDGTLQVDGNTELDGTLAVGPAGGAGLIDSGGVALAETDLEIGGGVATNNVLISKDGQRADILGDTRFNGNEVIMNDADDITDVDAINPENGGAGMIFVPNGGAPRINVYINGVIVGFFDAAGWN